MIHYSEEELNTIYQNEKFISEYNDYSKDNNDCSTQCDSEDIKTESLKLAELLKEAGFFLSEKRHEDTFSYGSAKNTFNQIWKKVV